MCRVNTVGRGNVTIEWINPNPRGPISTPVNGPTNVSTDTHTVNRASQRTPVVNCSAMIGNSESRFNSTRLTVTGTQ